MWQKSYIATNGTAAQTSVSLCLVHLAIRAVISKKVFRLYNFYKLLYILRSKVSLYVESKWSPSIDSPWLSLLGHQSFLDKRCFTFFIILMKQFKSQKPSFDFYSNRIMKVTNTLSLRLYSTQISSPFWVCCWSAYSAIFI